MTLIYIGDNLLDLYPDTQIVTTVKKIDIADIQRRNVTYTNQFKVPWTENNARILQYAMEEQSQGTAPYTIQSGKLVQNGIETIPSATITVINSSKKEFNITILENIFDFFNSVATKTIGEIAPITASGWEAADIDTARTNTSGIISAVFSWGYGSIYNVNFYLPSFYYHSLITSILEYTGLTVSGSIMTDSRFTDLIVPYPGEKFEYPESYYGQFYKKTTYNVPVTKTNQVNVEAVVFGFSMTDAVHGTMNAYVAVGGIAWNGGTNLVVRLYKGAVLVDSAVIATNPAPGGSLFIDYTDFWENGDTFTVYVYSDDMAAPGTDYTLPASIYLEFIPDGKVNRALVEWNELFPQIKCVDLLRDFFTRFSLIPKQVDGTLILKSFEEVTADTAVDWSDKLVNVDDEAINFTTRYGQANNFDYQNLADSETLGRGQILINNPNLTDQTTMYRSVFGNSEMIFLSNYYVANVPVFLSTAADIYDFDESPGLRLLTLKDVDDEDDITFNATPRGDYKMGYFVDPQQSKDTGFQYFVDQFYPSLEAALQKNKVITKYFNLTELDIKQYDPHKMIYDGKGYYIVNTIQKFIPGVITKVELFKIL